MARTSCGFVDGPIASATDLLARWGPTLLVGIGFDTTWQAASGTIPVAAVTDVHALVDSGASESCIDALFASQLGLPIVDRRPISGVGGQHVVNMHLAQIHVEPLAFTIWGIFAGVNLAAGGQPHQALIGRTFLRHFTMIYEGRTGNVVIHNE
jgi:hypothetical protein